MNTQTVIDQQADWFKDKPTPKFWFGDRVRYSSNSDPRIAEIVGMSYKRPLFQRGTPFWAYQIEYPVEYPDRQGGGWFREDYLEPESQP